LARQTIADHRALAFGHRRSLREDSGSRSAFRTQLPSCRAVPLPSRQRDAGHLPTGRSGCDQCDTDGVETQVITVRTGSRPTVVDLTGEANTFVQGRGDGLLHVFTPHATAGLAIIETGAGSDVDLLAAVEEALPADDRWRHRHGS